MASANRDSMQQPGELRPVQAPALLVIPIENSATSVTEPPGGLLSPQRAKKESTLALEERLQLAAQRREEFRSWVLSKARSKRSVLGPAEDRRQQRLQKIKERQAAAETARAQVLDTVRRRAASVAARRDSAIARVQQGATERHEALAARVANSLTAAEERRSALLEAERERLRAEHELVLSRLALSREEPSAAAEARKKLEEKLAAAEELRQQRLAQASHRAGSKVQHAKTVSALTKQIKEQQAAVRLENLQARLESAEQRRLSARHTFSPTSSPAAAGLPSTPTRPRTSVGGSAAITSPPLTPEGSMASYYQSEQDGFSTPQAVTPRPHVARALSLSKDEPSNVSQQLLAEVGQLVSNASAAAALPAALPMTKPSSASTSGVAADAEAQQQDKAAQAVQADGAQQVEEAMEPVEALRRSISSRKLQAAWRAFRTKHRTTAQLCRTFVDTGVIRVGPVSHNPSSSGAAPAPAEGAGPDAAPGPAVVGALNSPVRAPRGADQFDAFARIVQSSTTLRAGSALLRRLESRLLLRSTPTTGNDTANKAAQAKHHHHHHHHKGVHSTSKHHSAAGAGGSLLSGGASERNVTRILRRLYPDLPKDRVPDRYPPRILLCSLMIIHYPEVVFNGSGDRESKLTAAAKEMISKFERLLARILDPPPLPLDAGTPADADSASPSPRAPLPASPVALGIHTYLAARAASGSSGGSAVTIAQRLVEFDEAWLQYLDQFAAWKLEDAASLESELIRVAAEMERSLQRKLVRSSSSPPGSLLSHRSSRNLDSVAAQVQHDYELLRERIERLSGPAGLARLDDALRAVREQVALESASESASEMESDLEGGRPAEQGRSTGSPTHRARSMPTAGIRRGFFGSPAVRLTPGSPTTSSVPSASSGSPTRISATTTPRTPFASAAPATTHTTSSITASPAVQGAPTLDSPRTPSTSGARPPELHVSDVRAPSVPRSPASSSPYTSNPLSPVEAAGSDGAPDAQMVSESIANLQLVWELVHNPAYKMSGDQAETSWQRALAAPGSIPASLDSQELEGLPVEEMVAKIKAHARAVTETVFWDHIATSIQKGIMDGNLDKVISMLISELGTGVADVMSDPSLQSALKRDYAAAHVQESLQDASTSPGSALQLTASYLQKLALLLLQNGAPAREAEAKAAHADLALQLGAAIPAAVQALMARGASDAVPAEVEALSQCIAKALRVLEAQLKLLKHDAANARLALLYRQVKGDSGVTYIRNKFSLLHSLPPIMPGGNALGTVTDVNLRSSVTARLPRLSAWVHRAGAAAPAIQQYLQTVGLDLASPALIEAAQKATAAATAAAAVPATLQAGLRAVPGSSSSPASSVAPAHHKLQPASLSAWQGILRTGVIALVSSDKPAVSSALAETLAWDAERLHAAQNSFQQLVVLTAAMLLVHQTRVRAGRQPLTPAQVESARQRIQIVLADPGMSFQSLVSQLYALTLAPSSPDATSATTAEQPAAESASVSDEAALGTAFRALMNPSSAAFTSIANALAGALSVHLLLGSPAVASDATVSRGVAQLLGRVGAGSLSANVESLARQLAAMCGTSEVVFGPVYAALMSTPPPQPTSST